MFRLMMAGGLGVLAAAALTPEPAEAQRGGWNRGGGGARVATARGGWRGGARLAPRGNFARGPRYVGRGPAYRGAWRGPGYGRPFYGRPVYGRPGWGWGRPGWGRGAVIAGVGLGVGAGLAWGGGWGGPYCDWVPGPYGWVEQCW
jgi:hypothetical protein